MSTQPHQRVSVVTDLCRLLLDRLIPSISGCFAHLVSNVCMDIEVLVHSNSGVMCALQSEGVQKILGHIIVSDSDPLLLV